MLTTRPENSRVAQLNELLKVVNDKREEFKTTVSQLFMMRNENGIALEKHLSNKFQANITEARKIKIEEIKKSEEEVMSLIVAYKGLLDMFATSQAPDFFENEKSLESRSLAIKKTLIGEWQGIAASFYDPYKNEWDATKANFLKTLLPEIIEESSEVGVAPKFKVLDEKFYDSHSLDSLIKLNDDKINICYNYNANKLRAEKYIPVGQLFLFFNEDPANELARKYKKYFTACPQHQTKPCYLHNFFIPNQLIAQITQVLEAIKVHIDPIIAGIEPAKKMLTEFKKEEDLPGIEPAKKMLTEFKKEEDLPGIEPAKKMLTELKKDLADLEPQSIAKAEELIESGKLEGARIELIKFSKINKKQKGVLKDKTKMFISLRSKYGNQYQSEVKELANKILELSNVLNNNKAEITAKKNSLEKKAAEAAAAAAAIEEEFNKQINAIVTKIEEVEKKNGEITVLTKGVTKDIDSKDLLSPKQKLQEMKSHISGQENTLTNVRMELKFLKESETKEHKKNSIDYLEGRLDTLQLTLTANKQVTSEKSGLTHTLELFSKTLKNLQEKLNQELKQFDEDKQGIEDLAQEILQAIVTMQTCVKRGNWDEAQRSLQTVKIRIEDMEKIESAGFKRVSELKGTKIALSEGLDAADNSAMTLDQKSVKLEYKSQMRELTWYISGLENKYFEVYRETSGEYARLTILQAKFNEAKQAAERLQEIKKAIDDHPDYWKEAVRIRCKDRPDSLIQMRDKIAEYERNPNRDAATLLAELKMDADESLHKGNAWRYTTFHLRDPRTDAFLNSVKSGQPFNFQDAVLATHLQQKRAGRENK